MDFIDARDDLKRYWEEYINNDCIAVNLYNNV